jgi:hypothetical protein
MLMTVTDRVAVPEATVPKSMLEGFTVTRPGLAPVPCMLRLRGRLELSLVNLKVSSATPTVFGLKLTLKGTSCPGERVSGKLNPLMLNPEPTSLTAETVI